MTLAEIYNQGEKDEEEETPASTTNGHQ